MATTDSFRAWRFPIFSCKSNPIGTTRDFFFELYLSRYQNSLAISVHCFLYLSKAGMPLLLDRHSRIISYSPSQLIYTSPVFLCNVILHYIESLTELNHWLLEPDPTPRGGRAYNVNGFRQGDSGSRGVNVRILYHEQTYNQYVGVIFSLLLSYFSTLHSNIE